MKRKITDNIGLKILAFVLAALLWLVSVNINDPTQTKTFRNIPVEILNKGILANDGKVYEVLDNSNVIDRIQITGKRSILDEISEDNIHATADMAERTFNDTVRINVTTNKYASRLEGNINVSNDILKIKVEDMKKMQLVVKAVTKDEPAAGYMVGGVSLNQNLVQLTGSESAISQIASAGVTVSVAGMKEDIKTEGALELYDAKGNLIDNANITKSISRFNVTVEILQMQKVPLRVVPRGTPAEGYRATGVVECSPETIVIAGKSSIMKHITEITVDDIAIGNAQEDVLTYFEPRRYLPDGVILAGGTSANAAAVKVYIEKEAVETFTMHTKNLRVIGLPEDMAVNTGKVVESVDVTLRGLRADLDKIDEAALTGTADVAAFMESSQIEKLREGRYHVAIAFDLPENVELGQEVQIILDIQKKPAE